MALIHELLPKVMADIGAIGKTQHNKVQGFDFRGVDDVLNHCNPSLAKHGVTLEFQVRDHKIDVVTEGTPERAKRVVRASLLMAVRFYASDGSSIENVSAGEALDYNGDKATNKAMAAAFKYGLFFGLCIPVSRTAIDDADSHRSYTEPEFVPDPVPDTGSTAKAAVSNFTRAKVKIDNAMTIEDLNKCQERLDEFTRLKKFKPGESKQLADAINTRARQISGREAVTA